MSKERNTSLTLRFAVFVFGIWFPAVFAALWLLWQSGIVRDPAASIGIAYLAAFVLFGPMIYKACIGTGKAANVVELNVDKLPSFESLSTAHWSADEQTQFAKAVEGIRSVDWIFTAMRIRDDVTRHRVATAFAFAAFSELRRRLRLASDEELMRDACGRRSPNDTK